MSVVKCESIAGIAYAGPRLDRERLKVWIIATFTRCI